MAVKDNIPIHFTKGGGTSGFVYTFDTCQGKKDVSFDGAADWVNVDTSQAGKVILTADASPASQIEDWTSNVTIKVNDRACADFVVTREKGTDCKCETALIPLTSQPIPSDGGDVDLGTFSFTDVCIEMNETATVSPQSATTWLTNVRINGTTIVGHATKNISGERGATITFGGTMKDTHNPCTTSINVTQDSLDCECGDSTFKITTESPIQIQSEGDNFEFSYIASDCVKSVSDPTVDSGGEGWISGLELLPSGKKVTGTVSSYSETTTRSATITISGTLIDNTTICTASIVIEQSGVTCGCGNINFTLIGSIPSTGMSVDDELGTYSILNGCDETKYTAKMTEGNNTYNVTLSNGKILLKTLIPEIDDDYEGDKKIFTLHFYYNNVECNDLKRELEQLSIPCSCESIWYFVKKLKQTFPLSGTTDYVVVASGNTYGCGSLSAITNAPEMLEGGDLVIEKVGEYEYLFKAKILPYDDPSKYRTCGNRLYFMKKDQTEWDECDASFILIQSEDYCDCSMMNMYVDPAIIGNKIELDCGKDAVYVVRANCGMISGSSDVDWLTTTRMGDWVGLESTSMNDTGAERTGHFTFTGIVDYDPNYPSGVICSARTFTVTQKACKPCDCYELSPSLAYDYCTEIESNALGSQYVNYLNIHDSDCIGDLYEGEGQPKLGDYRVVFCGFVGDEDHSWLDEDEPVIIRGTSIDVNVVEENTGDDRSVHFEVGVEYYTENGWTGGCSDYHCQPARVCVTQKHSICSKCDEIDHHLNDTFDCEAGNNVLIYSNDAQEVCGYFVWGETVDENGYSKTYDWVYVNNATPPLTEDILRATFTKNEDDEPREAYILAYWADKDGNRVLSNCQYKWKITQKACVEPSCNCSSYTLYVDRNGYPNELVDGSGQQAVAKIFKNTAPCINVYPEPQQTEFINAFLRDIPGDDDYQEVIVDVYDSSLTTAANVTVDIKVMYTEDDPPTPCTNATIQLRIDKKP